MSAVQGVQVKNDFRYAITIPDNTGNGSTILALLQAQGFQGSRCHGVIIRPYVPGVSGAQRAAFVAACPRVTGGTIASTDFTTHGDYVAAGEAYYTPADADSSDTYVRSASGSTVSALAIVLY